MMKKRRETLPADQVRQLPIGATVRRHSFDKYGYPVWVDCTVVQPGKRKMLMVSTFTGPLMKAIYKESDRMYYSVEVEDE